MLVANLPETARVGIVGHALEHHGLCAVRERTVDDVRVPGHPADVGRAPVDVAGFIVEDVLERQRRVNQITAGRVQDALGLAGGTRGIQDEQGVLGVHRLAGAVVVHGLLRLVQPDVAAIFPSNVVARIPHDQDFFQRRDAVDIRGRVDVGLQRHGTAAAHALVRRDDHRRLAVDDAAGQRVRRETAEHDGMDRADARAGEHRDRRFGDHRHIDRDAIAFLDANRFQHVGETANPAVQLAVGDREITVRLVPFPDDRGLVRLVGQVAIDAVVADVQFAVFVPADVQIVLRVGNVLDLGKGLGPVDDCGLLRPELLVVLDRLLVEVEILFLVY